MYYAKMYILGKTNAIDQIEKRYAKAEYKAEYNNNEILRYKSTDDGVWLDREWIDDYLKEYGELGILTKADITALKDLRQKAFYITGIEEEKVLKEVYHAIDSGLRSGQFASDIIANIENTIKEYGNKYALTIARTNSSDAYNTAQANLFMSDNVRPYIEAYMFSAIMDDNTTDICRGLDGQIIRQGDPDFKKYLPPLHFNCRSELVPIFINESENEDSYFYGYKDNMKPIDKSIQPSEGFGG
jgi:SPP1 gp7 family putative phage head morphogenesis protein